MRPSDPQGRARHVEQRRTDAETPEGAQAESGVPLLRIVLDLKAQPPRELAIGGSEHAIQHVSARVEYPKTITQTDSKSHLLDCNGKARNGVGRVKSPRSLRVLYPDRQSRAAG